MSSTTSAINTIDPTALLQEREEMDRQNIVKVPEVIDQVIAKINEAYPVLYESDYTNPEDEQLAKAKLITVVVQKELRAEPSRLRRFFEYLGARQIRALLQPEETMELACWEVTWVNMVGPRRPFVTIFVSVVDGTLYAIDTAGGKKAYPLDRTILETCTYPEAMDLLKRAQSTYDNATSQIEHQKRKAQWAAEDAAAKANEIART